MNHYYLIIVGVWMFLCSIQDIKRKEIHISLLIMGVVPIMVSSIFWVEISLQNRLLGILLGGILLIIHWFSKGQIGLGDVIVVSILGGSLGFYLCSGILMFSLFLSAILSLVLIVFKRVKRKTTIPFTPFLFIGYVGVLVFV